ncbi:uncharacterized protein LOC111288568 [Durio zibethinus]|uniref:Uncharacterized protein LOC111288568 n=1 Tax=Durio zibethinus TaxID=66656 RepID=A0A6P5Y466_DURZI|nr:uncharacterized protein LOC111288568 [Durio zibethinus]XP_022735238.1 uncharacterized protein LOC111288568 [Durio zibethinus]
MHRRSSKRSDQKKRRLRILNSRMKRLRVEMEEISEEQKQIKDGQKQVREKFQAIELECEQLRKETILVIQQSVSTQIRLALMFQILKARESHDFSKASQLTCALRELVAKEDQQRKL